MIKPRSIRYGSTIGIGLAYIALVLAILLPLLCRGFTLTLDLIFTPKLRMPTTISSSYIFSVILHDLNFILPSEVIEKIVLFFILVLSGIGMHLLAQYISRQKPNTYQSLSFFFAGLLYTINPFTYDRFMAGQYEILLGYALIPWFVVSLLKFTLHPSLRQAIILAAGAVIISIVSIPTIGSIAIFIALSLGFKSWQNRKDKPWLKSITKFGLLALSIFIVASSYWLVPLVLGHGNTATTIDNFNTTDQMAFSTLGGSVLGRLENVLKLQGFWAESRGLYTLPQEHVATWELITLLVWLLIVIGAISLWRTRQRFVVILFGSMAIVAIVLAIGTFNNWLATYIPFFAGYREPEKFVALVALSYAVFAGFGVSTTLQFCHDQGGRFFLILGAIVLLCIPLIWTSTMLWGFNNQLTPVQYPGDWYAMNKRLDADHSNFQVLFLPWHQYMSFNFAGRIIGNPAPQFFDKSVIISNNPQFKGIAPGTPNPEDTDISNILASASEKRDFGASLARYHVKYILLDFDSDYTRYSYLNHQTDLQVVAKGATLELYRNTAFQEQR